MLATAERPGTKPLAKRLESLNPEQKLEVLRLLEARQHVRARQRFYEFFPDTGPLRRELYPKHLEFFSLGREHRERLACCANRVGKTSGMGGYELVAHMTGEYPAWWPGRRFTKPVDCWAAGDTGKTTRDILQRILLGPIEAIGTGMVPGRLIKRCTPKSGVPDAIETIETIHVPTGRVSRCQLKSYDQKRESFQGEFKHVILLDEEPPIDVYGECVMRTMATPDHPEGGMVMTTYTPIKGLTELTLAFLPEYAPGDTEDEAELEHRHQDLDDE